jgi:thioredoxin 1
MAELVLTSDNFETEVIAADIPVLVDFWAPWCGPCKMLAPMISQIATKYSDRIKVGKVDVDEYPVLAESFGISSIPTLVLFKDGQAVSQRTGGAPMAVLEAFINDALS